jgi:hypothetical protein
MPEGSASEGSGARAGGAQDPAAASLGGRTVPGSEQEGEPERVEQRFERWGRRVGRLLAVAAARTREEAEDILAEAQSIRRGERD